METTNSKLIALLGNRMVKKVMSRSLRPGEAEEADTMYGVRTFSEFSFRVQKAHVSRDRSRNRRK